MANKIFKSEVNETSEVDTQSIGTVVKEVGSSAKNLVQSELELLKAEVKDSSRDLSKHAAETAIFGGLFVVSVLPLLAFLVIALGRGLNNRYWLSSLIVAVACAAIGGPVAYRAFKKIKNEDLTLPRTSESLGQSRESISAKIEDVKEATHRRSA